MIETYPAIEVWKPRIIQYPSTIQELIFTLCLWCLIFTLCLWCLILLCVLDVSFWHCVFRAFLDFVSLVSDFRGALDFFLGFSIFSLWNLQSLSNCYEAHFEMICAHTIHNNQRRKFRFFWWPVTLSFQYIYVFSFALLQCLNILRVFHPEYWCSISAKYRQWGVSVFSWSFTLAVTAVTIMQILPKLSQRKCPGVGKSEVKMPTWAAIMQKSSIILIPDWIL